jgi:PHD/YefM family antitoxin component YafN of YafNO toxin-antitoxin module
MPRVEPNAYGHDVRYWLSLQETLYLFSTRANAVHILRGLAEARDGAAQPTELEELAARFDVQADG